MCNSKEQTVPKGCDSGHLGEGQQAVPDFFNDEMHGRARRREHLGSVEGNAKGGG